MTANEKSFRLDRKARSFRISDFALRDLPMMGLVWAWMALIALVMTWVLELLPEKGRWTCLGLALGFYLGLLCGSRGRRSSPSPPAQEASSVRPPPAP